MRPNILQAVLRTAALSGAGLLLAAGVARAAAVDVYLQTLSTTKPLPGLVDPVPTWVFVCDPGAGSNPNCTASAGGSARIDAAPGDDLTVHLTNTLPMPVSLAIPGQTQSDGGDPVMSPDALARDRVRSFTHETAAGTIATPSAEVTYSWGSLRPGTYLYQSGTHPSIQVPMGLFGALVVGPATLSSGSCASGQPAYDTDESCYDAEALLLLSEIDPVQNAAVEAAAGVFAAYPSTVDYSPTYILVNGETSAALPAAAQGSRVLLRFLNAGLRSHTPAIVGLEMGLIAEDGNPYPGQIRWQSAALLPAGKTLDLRIAAPAADATFALFDRMPTFSNDAQPEGVRLAILPVGAGSGAPPPFTNLAVDDTYPVTEDTPLVTAAPGVLGNDDPTLAGAAVVSGPLNGTLVLGVDGSFTYTPRLDFSGADGFTYNASDGVNIYTAKVTLNVSFVNDAPVAAPDGPYVNAIGTSIAADPASGVLGNDMDPDGDALTAVIDGTPPAGLTLNGDGSFTYDGLGGSTTFSYTATDGLLSSDPATVTLTINPVANIALTVQDPDGTLVADYRWTVEEDTTWQPDPSVVPPPPDTLGTNFHRSYMPVVAQGCVGTACGTDPLEAEAPFALLALDPLKHYYVSVLPADAGSGDGHTIGGARIPPAATRIPNTVTVNVNKQPIPYAQISVFVFEDNSPTNGAVDGAETGLGGFQITLEDAGGRYGISAGMMMQDADGNMLTNSLDCFGGNPPGMGVILSCPDTPANRAAGLVGQALIKNLFPGKYGVITSAPPGSANQWVQTSTIEGTKVIDAWVKAGEPAFFQEFGPAGWHVFVGFVSPARVAAANPPVGPNTVTGKVTNLHMSRPPDQRLWDSTTYDALAHTRAWVGLNSAGGTGPNIAAVQAAPDGSFTISGVPNGIYQLVVWDSYLDQVIAYRAVTLTGGTGAALGNVPVFQWFARLENNVFLDDGAGGGIAGDAIRNGAEAGIPEQAVNLRWRDGSVYQSFPTDTEGFVPFDQVFPFFHWLVAEVDYTRFKATGLTVTVDGGGDVAGTGTILNPQAGSPRTEIGPVLTQGFQGFLGQTSIFDWGKAPYPVGENGGISGIVYYGVTRAENDPRLAAAEPWEPGIPRVKVRLYREVANSGGGTALALVQEVQTDSWDDSLPEECPGYDPADPILVSNGGPISPDSKCYDGLRNFNQARPAVFDGGYAFNDIPAGRYVVEVVPPPGYHLLKEEDVNVGFGDVFAMVPAAMMLPGGMMVMVMPDQAMVLGAMAAEPGLAQPPCVGELRTVPPYLSLFPSEMAEAPFAGALRPLCNRKRVILSDQGQAAADFTLFTGAPVAGHFAGMILDDVAQEFNPLSPAFGEKWAPPFVPVSIRDHLGREISRVYSDQWGRMNGLVPATFTANMPSPSGFSPAMLMTCMNDPGPIPDPANPGLTVIDPQYNPAYSNFCYTFQYMPGTTTYLDTPVLPVSAFASGYNPPDCAFPDGTPVIASVGRLTDFFNPTPWVPSGSLPNFIVIRSVGTMSVPNPSYDGPLGVEPATISRDFSFGSIPGTVRLGGTTLVSFWFDGIIIALVPPGASTGELAVTRGDNGSSSIAGATLTISDETPIVVSAGGSIQDAIDASSPGDLILVEPGNYEELVIMWKPVRLQGAGADTIINAVKRPTEKLVAWRAKMDCLFGIGPGCTQVVNALPNQLDGAAGFDTEDGAAITVVGTSGTGANSFAVNPSRIDGFSITGGDTGGGIFVNGYAHNLEIANNRVFGNSGSYHGGIRVGRPFLDPFTGGGFNTGVNIHNNAITHNGGLGGAGGGLSLCTGTDEYTVSRNFVCGNFTTGDGGGIGHLGYSPNGTIAFNQVLFNQSFNQAVTVSGGGLFIGGEPALAGGLSPGSGPVSVDANLFQGNHAGAGHGGGIRTQFAGNFPITLTNNMIVNNVAGWSGAGISLQDTPDARIVNNTIAHNDSTATVGGLIVGNASAPQPAGISSELNTPALQDTLPGGAPLFSDPLLFNNIVWENRAFSYDATAGVAVLQPDLSQAAVGDCPGGAAYWDFGVLDGASLLSPTSSILSSTTGTVLDPTNSSADPDLVDPYCNGGRTLASAPGSIFALPALDEGGNAWIDVRFGPLTQAWPAGSATWNYHIGAASAGLSLGQTAGAPEHDFDGEVRPQGGLDIGADEVPSAPAPIFADLGITKTDGVTEIVSGSGLSYTIVATNYGPDAVTGAGVFDGFPAGFTGVTWTCGATAGSSCAAAGGAGVISTTVSLLSGGSATFLATGTATGTPGSQLVNTVAVIAPGGATDPVPGNNSATDTDTFIAPPILLYFSTVANFAVPGVLGPYDDADIYSWNGSTFARVFDGSVAGLPGNADIDALLVVDADTFYLSFSGPVNPPGPLGIVQDEDIVLYDAGTWSLYFDGSDVGLANGGNAEDVDAFDILPDGSIVISTRGFSNVPGLGNFADEDLVRCIGTFGPATTCSWSRYFDGSDVGLTAGSEDVDGVSVSAGGIYLTTQGNFSIPITGPNFTGQGADVFVCNGPTTGPATSCSSFSMYFDGSVNGITNNLDAIDVP